MGYRSRPERGRRRAVAAAFSLVAATIAGGWVAAPAEAAGTTYYVDQGSSSCSDAGPGTDPAAAFCTLTKAARTAAAGDTVLVADGQYREQVAVGSGVTWRATGSAAILLGTDSLDTAAWSPTTGTAWTTLLSGTAVPSQVFSGATRLAKASATDQTTSGSWFFDSASRTLSVDVGGPAPTPADALEVGMRSYGFLARATTGVVLDGFVVRRPNIAGVQLDSTTSSLVRGVRVSESGAYGVNDTGGTTDQVTGVGAFDNQSIGIRLFDTTDGTISSSTSHDNQFHGVSVQGGSGARVTGVVSHHNKRPGTRVAAGIDVSSASLNAVVAGNQTYLNDDSGVEIYTGSTGALVSRNESYDNGDHGIDVFASGNARVVSNTAVGNFAAGLNVEGGSTGAALRDNIAVDNAVGSTRSHGDIRVDPLSVAATTIDSDLTYQSGAGSDPLYEWDNVNYTDPATLRAATGQEAHGLAAAPGFTSLAQRDLSLTLSSPAVDAADATASGWADADLLGHAPVDQPDVVDTGAGSPAWADLGARELTTVPPDTTLPTAALTPDTASTHPGQAVHLDASASTDNRGVASYTFSCDGTTAGKSQAGPTFTCSYATPGSYRPKVTVADKAGNTAVAQATVDVTAVVVPAPTAALAATPSTVRQGVPVKLAAGGSHADPRTSILRYAFDCGPGAAVVRSTPTYTCTYATTGTYTASVKVTDALGKTATARAAVTVRQALPPTPRLTLSDSTPKRGQRITANAARSSASPGSTITGYRFRCGTQALTTWRARSTATCSFSRTGRKVVRVWVRTGFGLVGTTSKVATVHR